MIQPTYSRQPQKNRRILVSVSGGPEVLQIEDVPVESPNAATVLIRIEAAGVTYHDLIERRGQRTPGSTTKLPYVPGAEAVGVVEAIGEGVQHIHLGQRVAAALDQGGYATYASVPAWRCIPVPDGVKPELAAALIVNYWTAYHILQRTAKLKPGQRVLVHGGAGGLGSAVLQLGRQFGLDVYATASAAKHDFIRANGATPIDYRTEDFVQRIHQLTADGVDLVIDSVGGDYWLRSYRTLRKGGLLVVCGLQASPAAGTKAILGNALNLLAHALWPDGKRVRLVGLSPDHQKDSYLESQNVLMTLLRDGKINPQIGAQFPLEKASTAHELLQNAQVIGKILLIPE